MQMMSYAFKCDGIIRDCFGGSCARESFIWASNLAVEVLDTLVDKFVLIFAATVKNNSFLKMGCCVFFCCEILCTIAMEVVSWNETVFVKGCLNRKKNSQERDSASPNSCNLKVAGIKFRSVRYL